MEEDAPKGEPEEHSTGLPTSVEMALMPSNKNIIITEPNEPFRIVHVNEAWCRSCGFDAEEVLGQTCRIMQGPGTCKATLKMLRQALLLRRQFAVQLLNYSKQGRPFMNTLQVGPLYNAAGQVTHFIGVVLARYLDGGGLVPPSVQQMGTPALGEPSEDGLLPQKPEAGMGSSALKRNVDERDAELEMHVGPSVDGGEDEAKYSPHDEVGSSSSSGRVPPFLTKLCEILTAEMTDVVSISPESASFTIWDPSRFAKEVLPRYFKHNKLGSFSQQLHTYGFRRQTSSISLDTAIEFYHEQYNGEASEFLAWIRAGGAISKRTTHTRPVPSTGSGVPPSQLLGDLWQVQEGIKQLAMTFQQIKAAHSVQIRTILTKLTLRGTLTPESASYLSALPPATSSIGGFAAPQPPANNVPPPWESLPLSAGQAPTEDNLQAHLDALEAGLPPLMPSHGAGQSSSFPMGEGNDFQGEEALQMYVDSAPNAGGSSLGSIGGLGAGSGFGMGNSSWGSMGMKDHRQQPYPVDVISAQHLYGRLGGGSSQAGSSSQMHQSR